MGEPVRYAEPPHEVLEPLPVDLPSREVQGQCDVLGGGERRDEVEGLENKPDPLPAQDGTPIIAQGGQIDFF